MAAADPLFDGQDDLELELQTSMSRQVTADIMSRQVTDECADTVGTLLTRQTTEQCTVRHGLPLRANTTFAKHALFAGVGAFFVVVAAIPAFFQLYPLYEPMQDRMRSFGDVTVIWGWPSLICVLSLAPTRGSTLQNSWQLMTGAIFACLNNAFLQPLLVSLAYHNRWYVTCVCWADYVAFIVFALAFDFGPRARLIALHFNTAWTLKLINPSTTEKWVVDTGYGYDFSAVAFGCLLRHLLGSTCAILAVHLTAGPSCLQTATASATSWAQTAALVFESAWKLVIERVDGEGRAVTPQESKRLLEKWFAVSSSFPAGVAAAQAATDIAWWESFGKSRQKAYAGRGAAQVLGKRLGNGIEGLSIQMDKMKTHLDRHTCGQTLPPVFLESATALSHRLLPLARELLVDVVSSPMFAGSGEDSARQQKASLLRSESVALGSALDELKVGETADHNALLVLRLVEAYTQTIADAADQEVQVQPQWMRFRGIWTEPTPGQVNYVVRNAVNIFIAALLGVYGLKFDGSIATNIGWLTSKYLGSSVRKNLQRILGIVVPFVVSGFAYDVYGDCSTQGVAALVTIKYVWAAFCLYLMVASMEFSYFALLCGAMSCFYFDRKCTEDARNQDLEGAVLQSIRGVVFAGALMLVGDVIMSPRSASNVAANMILEIWVDVKQELEDHIMSRGNSRRLGKQDSPETSTGSSSQQSREQTHTFFGTSIPAATPVMMRFVSERIASMSGRIAAARRSCAEASLQPFLRYSPINTDVANEVLQAINALQHEVMMVEAISSVPEDIFEKQRASIAVVIKATDVAIKMWLAPETNLAPATSPSIKAGASPVRPPSPTLPTIHTECELSESMPATSVVTLGLLRDIQQRLGDIELIFVRKGLLP